MKFGKYLASRQLELPEYSGHFINYKALKKLIKQLAIPSTDTNNNQPLSQIDVQKTLKENNASFFFKVERELEKVNSFYLEKQANLSVNLDLLLVQRDELFINIKRIISQDKSFDSDNLNSNFKNSITYLNLYQNFKKIHQDLLRLQQFILLNETGFLKVVKKWDKRSKSHTKELFILTAVNVQPVFYKHEINELSDLVTTSLFDLESVIDGDLSPIKNFTPTKIKNINNQLLNNHVAEVTGTSPPTTTTATTLPQPSHSPHSQPSSNIQSDISHLYSRTGSLGNLAGDNNSIFPLQSHNTEIDELYTSFVNIVSLKDPDMELLKRWMNKVNNSCKSSENNESEVDANLVKLKYSRVFLLSITNLKISDNGLQPFLELIDYNIDISEIKDNFNNNKNVLHECCSIPSSSTQESNVIINNGVKVIKSTDLINHSRVFIVKTIIEKSPDLCNLLISKDFNGRNCLHYAAQYNRVDLLEIILPKFPKNHLDDLDNESMSPLLLGIKYDNFQVIKILIDGGCNIYPDTNDDKLQYFPINYSCKIGHYETVKYLLSTDVPLSKYINNQDVEGLLPLHVVARSGHHHLIPLLVDNGSDINQIDSLNKWPPLFYASLEGNLRSAQQLLHYGARLDIIDDDGYNVLYYCVVEGHISLLNEFLKYYPKIVGGGDKCQLVKTLNNDGHKDKKPKPSTTPTTNSNSNSDTNGGSNNRSTRNRASSLAILDVEIDSEDNGEEYIEKNVDSIPDLQLPPPILPLRRYGHNFLEQKVLIELVFPNNATFINLFNSNSDLKPGRITLSSNISDVIPRNIMLPSADETRVSNCIFQTDVDSLSNFRIDFEIFPKFGTRLIAKTTALSFSQIDTSSPEINSIRLPLFDLRSRNIGEIKFNCQVIFPFAGTLLEASKFDTYWKSSTKFIKDNVNQPNGNGNGNTTTQSPNSYLSPSKISPPENHVLGGTNLSTTNELISGSSSSSFVTATSLSGQYLRVKVCLLNDGTPVVCPNWSISITDNIDLYLPNLSLEQLTSITENLFDYDKVLNDLSNMTINDIPMITKLLQIIYLPLDLMLQIINVEINLNIEIIFPSEYEIRNLPFVANVSLTLNAFIDLTLNDIFNHLRALRSRTKSNRSIIFLSSNSLICKILNWKQPNYPVFLVMNGISYDLVSNNFESRSTNGLIIVDGSDDESSSSDSDDAMLHEKNSDPDKLIENDQEKTSKSIKDAVNFAVNNNLIGLITSIHLLRLVPKLIPLIRSRGLILVANNDSSQDQTIDSIKELDTYTRTEINGLRFDDVLTFKDDVSM